jgi:hypothetical protein
MDKFISPMVWHERAHKDHSILPQHWGYALDVAGMHRAKCQEDGVPLGALIRTVELPEGCPDTVSGLYGPAAGDAPVPDGEVVMEHRGQRAWPDRLVDRPMRASRLLTIIAVPGPGDQLVCFTMYGGPMAPQNPEDPGNRDPEGARVFWSQHALAR